MMNVMHTLIGKNIILPITGRLVPVVADEYVERFGTGCVKITPAHTTLMTMKSVNAVTCQSSTSSTKMPKCWLSLNISLKRVNKFLKPSCPADYIGLERFAARKNWLNKRKLKAG